MHTFQPRPVRAWLELALLAATLATASIASGGCSSDTEREGDVFGPSEPYGLYTYQRAPKLTGPSQIDFGELLEGERSVQVLEFRNDGPVALRISEWTISPEFELRFPNFAPGSSPVSLGAGRTLVVEVAHVAAGATAEGELRIASDDPAQPLFRTTLLANIARRCLTIMPRDRVDFGAVLINGRTEETLTLSNCSSRLEAEVVLGELEGDAAIRRIDELGDQLTLAPDASVTLRYSLSSPRPGNYSALQRMRSDVEGAEDVRVELLGSATAGCPVAVLRAESADRGATEARSDAPASLEVEPLDTVSFESAGSFDPGGAEIVDVELSLISQPDDSTTTLMQIGDDRSGTMFMDLYGDYVLELHVVNSFGVRSCEPARLTVQAVSSEDIHIQLVWNTPGDSLETDNSGSDLDLHLLHPNGGNMWNRAPWDIYWENITADWGNEDDDSDDPSLDIDDIDGAGPENINLDNPEPGITYQVGAHYFSDHGYGPSFVTLRVYIGGRLAAETRRTLMRDQQFWPGMTINWPSGMVETSDTVLPSIPKN